MQRVIYLDADIIVRTDLTPLWATDLGEAVIGAVTDVTFLESHKERMAGLLDDEDRARFGFDSNNPYFNSGVLLIDLVAVRGAIENELLGVVSRYPGLLFPDQDALNIVLGQLRKLIDPRWNQTGATFWDTAEKQSGLPPEEFRRLLEDPWIVHFTWRPKPWEAGCVNPFQPAWQKPRTRRAAHAAGPCGAGYSAPSAACVEKPMVSRAGHVGSGSDPRPLHSSRLGPGANARCSVGFLHDRFADGRRFRIFTVVGDVTKECLAL